MRGGQNSINKTDSPFPFPDHLSFHYILLLSSWLLILSCSLLLTIVENGSFKIYQLGFAQQIESDTMARLMSEFRKTVNTINQELRYF